MTKYQVYRKADDFEDYRLADTIEIEDTAESKEELIFTNFSDLDGWSIDGDYEEFLNGYVDEIYFYRENVNSDEWDSDVAGYISKII
ncbi:hypothetical protein K8P03_10815 [Anaerococcus murdochii]|uniref:Uncharacterized protein n=1 Tax=Anaerococcus murdochii TaxID=411577 RepID=A0ABS7T1Y0_9FIRM|nr:hypothetical protein [Anaerococcus murdochii]MBZ2387763.1 hypothetical protein [Anaerococcus murdochii]